MSTIPASLLVSVNPSVLSAGGNAFAMNGLILTHNTRAPVGTVLAFPNDGISVSNFFGPSSKEAQVGAVYFKGFDNSTQKPSTILFAQYNSAAVAAYLRGGKVSQLTIAQLQGLTGSLAVTVDGYAFSAASVDLAPANSFSAAAAIIQTDLNTTLPAGASVTGAIAPATSAFTGSIAGNVLTVTAVASGELVPGTLVTGTGVTAATHITSQLSGTEGGVGTYAVSIAQVVPSETLTGAYGVLTASAVASGTLAVGQTIGGAGVTAGTKLTALGTGTGLAGTYFVDVSQTVASEAITATASAVAVTYDSVSGAFVIQSGTTGDASSIGFVSGTLPASIFLTQATGATLSQGADAATPGEFMDAITQQTQAWATFMTTFDPDGGSGNTQKLAFAAWTNNQTPKKAYIAWDTDITPTETANATASFGNILKTNNVSGTSAIWEPSDQEIAAFICGAAASVDYSATNGRITFAFKGQTGLVAGVTDATTYTNLVANGYGAYCAFATASQQFVMLQPGQVSGPFEWLDTYLNSIQLNQALQQALMILMTTVNSVSYAQPGRELIIAACADPINEALNFGSIVAGVELSAQQAADVNAAAKANISDILEQQGWYLQVLPATPQVRQARGTPPCNFWYCDGGAVQKLVLNSVVIQ